MTRIKQLRELIQHATENGFNKLLIDRYTDELNTLKEAKQKNITDTNKLRSVLIREAKPQAKKLITSEDTINTIKNPIRSIIDNIIYVGGIGYTTKETEAKRQIAVQLLLKTKLKSYEILPNTELIA